MSKKQLIGVVFALLALGACSTEQMVGTGVGAAGGYAVDGKRGAVIGGAGGGLLGTILD
ncbi:hypothetical protein JL100_006465 [Skermanella mucosa]|uniref:hypothetical protein n=1 Tax=Skermanella TaxID=204447 RepID=UPI0017879CD2|nr:MULTISPECIES: hypothetical protein [Skermanella]UEM22384.1 hypothetical protein JL100_006465 [Skermanella mucosa]